MSFRRTLLKLTWHRKGSRELHREQKTRAYHEERQNLAKTN